MSDVVKIVAIIGLVIAFIFVVNAVAGAQGTCPGCMPPEPEPVIPILPPWQCSTDTPWGCYDNVAFFPYVSGGSGLTIITPTATATPTPVPPSPTPTRIQLTFVPVTLTPVP